MACRGCQRDQPRRHHHAFRQDDIAGRDVEPFRPDEPAFLRHLPNGDDSPVFLRACLDILLENDAVGPVGHNGSRENPDGLAGPDHAGPGASRGGFPDAGEAASGGGAVFASRGIAVHGGHRIGRQAEPCCQIGGEDPPDGLGQGACLGGAGGQTRKDAGPRLGDGQEVGCPARAATASRH